MLLLYYFRTPPYVKVGRAAFDAEAMERLEQQHPDIKFEWDRILREAPQTLTEQEAARRKEQRDARDARRKRRRPVETGSAGGAEAQAESPSDQPDATLQSVETPEDYEEDSPAGSDVITTGTPESSAVSAARDTCPATERVRKRRRRRRRRGKKPDGEPGSNPPPGEPTGDA
jgi:hypothetical protein